MIIGYARVSTDGQTLDAQCASLKAAGAAKTFAEKVSALRPTVASCNRQSMPWALAMCCL
jgi:DNA invertase Pin-like site-specific DNA recombinase